MNTNQDTVSSAALGASAGILRAIAENPGTLLAPDRVAQLAGQLQAASRGEEVLFHEDNLPQHEAAAHKYVVEAQKPIVQRLCDTYGYDVVISTAGQLQGATLH